MELPPVTIEYLAQCLINHLQVDEIMKVLDVLDSSEVDQFHDVLSALFLEVHPGPATIYFHTSEEK